MTQNIYDDPGFFARYSQLPRSTEGLAGAPEWPALRAMLPDVSGLRVVDLGCGFGWFCRWARDQGAPQVLGIDVSERMLGRARAMTSAAAIRYERADLEHLALPSAAFDLAYSSLALHYIRDAGRLVATIHQALAPGGSLVFSTEHPLYTAPSSPGWLTGSGGRMVWPVESYADEGARVTNWLTRDVVKYHRRIATTLNLLIGAGFTIDCVEEFAPTEAQVVAMPELAEERERPMFLLVAARR